jgi:predicted dehydrogenase
LGIKEAAAKIDGLKRFLGVEAAVEYLPNGNRRDAECYKLAFKEISRPAVCIVAVPDDLHAEVAAAAISEGLHTLVVKPLAPTLKEVLTLVDMQRKSGVYCAVEFHKRYDLANLKLRDAVRSGVVGDPLYFLVEYSQKKSVPFERFSKWVETTNIFQYLGVHYVDIIYFATGAVPRRATAIGRKGWLASKGVNAYDSVEGFIEWEMPSGVRFGSCILTNWIDPESSTAMSDQKIKVIGTAGRLESDQKRRGITIVTDRAGVEEPNPYFCAPYGADGMARYMGYGIDSIHGFLADVEMIEAGLARPEELEETRPTFRQSIVPTVVVEAVNKSLADNGGWVDIDTSQLTKYGQL